MTSPTEITVPQLSRLVGLPDAPVLIDVCIDDDFNADPRLIPGSHRRDFRHVSAWAKSYAGKSVVVVCHKGQKLSQGVAAWLRHEGIAAQTLEGGILAWRAAGATLSQATGTRRRAPERAGKRDARESAREKP